jgi:hypothetical protein
VEKRDADSGVFRFIRLTLLLYALLTILFLAILLFMRFREAYDYGFRLLFYGLALIALGFLGIYADKTERSRGLFDYRIRTPLRLSRDMFPKYMVALIFSALMISATGILVMFLSARWEEKPTVPSVSSLKGALEEFEPYVQEWNPDAMMLSATVSFGANPWRIVTVYYQSYSDNIEFLRIALRPDGVIDVEVDDFDSPVDPKELFSISDWEIDSTEAIEIFAESEMLLSCMSSSSIKDKELRLRRRWEEPSVVQWDLYLDCAGLEDYSPIDAITGEPIYNN